MKSFMTSSAFSDNAILATFWGGSGTTSYDLLLALHFIAMVMVFGPMLVLPVILRHSRREGANQSGDVIGDVVRKFVVPGLVVALLSGVLLSLDSAKAFPMSAPWISAAFLVVGALLAITLVILLPARRAMLAASSSADVHQASKRVMASISTFHFALLVLLVLMLFKPGQ